MCGSCIIYRFQLLPVALPSTAWKVRVMSAWSMALGGWIRTWMPNNNLSPISSCASVGLLCWNWTWISVQWIVKQILVKDYMTGTNLQKAWAYEYRIRVCVGAHHTYCRAKRLVILTIPFFILQYSFTYTLQVIKVTYFGWQLTGVLRLQGP